MRDFKRYTAWQDAHFLTLEVYKITQEFPKEEMYGLTSQLRRAATSIPTNFAEGCGATSEKEFGRFLNIAIASCSEVEYLLLLVTDLKYITAEVHRDLENKTIQVRKQIYQLRQKLN